MTKILAGLFPGQGSQVVGMGENFFKTEPLAQELYHVADRTLGFSLSKLCFEGPLEKLTLTEFAQPAILATSYISYRLLHPQLSAAAGHSLGEYTALVAAGALSFADAVLLVHKRGRYMQEAVAPGEGKMAAVMGPSEEEINESIHSLNGEVVEIANLNSPGQIVVAGSTKGVDAFVAIIKTRGAKVIPLNVSAPFHCALMKSAQERLARDLDTIRFSNLQFPVYANVTGQPVREGTKARELLKQQVCGSVRWVDCVKNLCHENKITLAIEFGPGAVLSKLLKRIESSVPGLEVFDSETLTQARGAIGTT